MSSHRARTTGFAIGGLLALQLGWLLALVPYFGIDEFDHAYRASSVAEGNWIPDVGLLAPGLARGDLIPVRADVAAGAKPACTERRYTAWYNCHPLRDLNDGTVEIASAAARYNPLFYAVAGTVAKPFHGTAALVAMRIAGAVMCALLFGLATWLVLGWARTGWPLATLLLTALPTTVYSSTVAAPNGVEMFAGVTVWAALVTLFRPHPARDSRLPAYLSMTLGAAVIANTHTLGLLWVALIAAVVPLLHGFRRVWSVLLPRTRGEVVAVAAFAASALFELVWVLASGVNDPARETGLVPGSAWPAVLRSALLSPLQAIGAFPLRNDPAPVATYAIGLVAVVGLLVTALVRTGYRAPWVRTAAAILVLSYLVSSVLTVQAYQHIGAAWQGRYSMPFTVGVIVLAGVALEDARFEPRLMRPILQIAVLAWVTAHLLSQLGVVHQEKQLHDLVADTGWNAPADILLVAVAAAAAACWLLAVRATSPVKPASPELVADRAREHVVA